MVVVVAEGEKTAMVAAVAAETAGVSAPGVVQIDIVHMSVALIHLILIRIQHRQVTTRKIARNSQTCLLFPKIRELFSSRNL